MSTYHGRGLTPDFKTLVGTCNHKNFAGVSFAALAQTDTNERIREFCEAEVKCRCRQPASDTRTSQLFSQQSNNLKLNLRVPVPVEIADTVRALGPDSACAINEKRNKISLKEGITYKKRH